MSLSQDQTQWFATTFGQLVANVERAVVGKTRVVQQAFTCLIAEGHLLLEDFPGTGKTSLARAMAQTLRGEQQRIQFTPDLLPSDVTGVTIYDQASKRFEFRRGPVFANVVLADEINRASPKTQSALLEVMEENQVTVDGVTHKVHKPFIVIATMNPIEQAGTYKLPEAQLDRFLMKTSLGYPDLESTVQILANPSAGRHGSGLEGIISTEHVVSMIELAEQVHTDHSLLEYVSTIIEATRTAPDVQLGCSVRAGLGLMRAVRVWAAASGRNYVLPDDIKVLAAPTLAHRMVLDPEEEFRGLKAEAVIARILNTVEPPQQRGTRAAESSEPAGTPQVGEGRTKEGRESRKDRKARKAEEAQAPQPVLIPNAQQPNQQPSQQPSQQPAAQPATQGSQPAVPGQPAPQQPGPGYPTGSQPHPQTAQRPLRAPDQPPAG